jgi:hypothetical protein
MQPLTRRDFLKSAAVASASLTLASCSPKTPPAAVSSDPYITCFYQFNADSLKALSGPQGLPSGPQYLHIFSMSHAGHTPNPKTANNVRACGPSFKYARAIDIWKYKDWKQASDDQLRQWAIEFRREALPDAGPSDYFAFNEFPTDAESRPEIQRRVAHWIRCLHDPGDGGPKLKGVFYLVEENLVPSAWQGDAIDDLFAAIDETSVLVVGEHYHNTKFIQQMTPEKYTTHLFDLAQWLDASGKRSQQNIARHKYAVLHSSYYGPKQTPWEGLQTDTSTPAQLKEYFQLCTDCTRRSPYGKRRISFGPLNTKDLDTKSILPALVEVLHNDATRPS